MKYVNVIFVILIIVSCSPTKKSNYLLKKEEIKKSRLQRTHKILSSQYKKNQIQLFNEEKRDHEKLKVCFVGDTGIDSFEQKKVATKLLGKTSGCDRIYHLGDIIYQTGLKSINDPDLENKFLKYYNPFLVPFYILLGNHDYFGSDVDDWFLIAKKYKNLNFPHYYYAHKVNDICIVGIDTEPINLGLTGDKRTQIQKEWLTHLLETKLKTCKLKVLIGHHPYISVYKKRAVSTNMSQFYEENILGHFDIIITGHDHIVGYIDTVKGSDLYISGAGGQFSQNKSDKFLDLEKMKKSNGPGIISLNWNGRVKKNVKLEINILIGDDLEQESLFFTKEYKLN